MKTLMSIGTSLLISVLFIVIGAATHVPSAHASSLDTPKSRLAVATPDPNATIDATVDSNGNIKCPKDYVPLSAALSGKPSCVPSGSSARNPIYSLIRDVIRVLSGIFGLVLVLILVIAGFQYTISNGSPDDSKSAKNRIKAAVTGFVLYIFMIGILQLLLPTNTKIFGP